MAYKKYIKRDGKVFGPYVYHSRKINGRVITEYRGKHRKNFLDYLILVSVPVLLLLSIGLIFLLNPNYFESAKNIAFNSVNSITGLVTEEPVSEPEQMTETIPETIPEEIPQEEILPETPAEIVNEIQNETEIIEEINETVSEEIVENQTVSNDTIINETIETEENITETIPEQNITPETIINETETIEILNETLANITEQNITNETLINETIINITQENLTINTIQFQAVLNQPVKWKKEIISKDLGNVTIILPEISENVVVKKIKDNVEEEITSNSAITGAVIGGNENFIFRFLNNIIGRLTGKVVDETPVENAAEIEVEVEIDDENANYEIEYETPAPTSVEEEIQNGKRILVSGPEEVHYTDVLAFANLSENLQIKNPSKVKIKWIENDSYIVPISVEDKDNNGIYDYVEWIAPSLSEQTFEIILVSKAEHLDENKNFISDIYEQVKELDGIWSEEIPDTHYVRVTFEKNLTNENDITIYPRITSGNSKIEVYEENQNNLIAEFSNITENAYNKVFLTNLISESQDTFDLKVVSGSVEFEHIIDPSTSLVPTSDGVTSSQNVSKGYVTEATYTFVTNTDIGAESNYALVNTTSNGAYLNSEGTGARDAYVLWNVTLPAYDTIQSIYLTAIVSQATTAGADRLAMALFNYNAVVWNLVNWTNQTSIQNVTLNYNVSNSDNITAYVSGQSMQFMVHTNGTTNTATDISVDFMQVNVTYTAVADTTSPSINITFPSNLTNSSDISININFTVSELSGECWYSNDTYLVNRSTGGCGTNITNITWSEGIHNITVWVNDSSNNVNQSRVTFMIDSVLPAVEILNPSQNNTNTTNTAQNVNFTFSDLNGIFNIWYSNDTGLINRSLGSGGTFFNITNLTWSEGLHNVTIYVNDTFGNVNQSRVSFTVDTTNPDLTILIPEVNNTNTTNTNQNINFTFSDSFTQVVAAWYSNDTGLVNRSLGEGGTFFNITNITWSQGKHNVTIYVNDTLGNINKTSVSFTIDTIQPTISIAFPTINNSNGTNTLNVNFTASDSGSGLFNFWYSNDTYLVNRSLGVLGTSFNITNLTWSDAKHNVTIWANDSAGNYNFATISFTIDSVLPAISILLPATNNTNTTNTNQNINFTFSDSTGIDSVWYNNDTHAGANKSLGSGGTYFNITNITWSEGKHNVTVYVNDSAGNLNYTSVSFTVDTTNPDLNITFPEVNNTNTTDNLIDVNFTFFDSFTMVDSCWYSNDTYLINRSLGSGGVCANLTNITWSVAIHNITIYVNDTLGNLNYSTRTINVSSSNAAPTISIVYPENTSYNTNVSELNYTISDDDDLLDTCWYTLNNGATNTTITCGQNATGLVSSEGSSTWRVYANDTAGLEDSSSVTFFKDTIIPAVQFVSPTTATGNYSKSSIDANVTASDSGVGLSGINISLYNSTGIYQSNFSATSPLYVNYTLLPDGTYYLNATANDSLNNKNFTETRTITLDTSFPQISIVFPTTNNTNTTNTNLDINFTVSDNILLSSCWYSNDSYLTNTTITCGQNITTITWSQGKHNVTVWTNDSLNQVNQSSISFTVDTTNPLVVIATPTQNNTNSSNTGLDVNYTATDTFTQIDSAWYSNDTYLINRSLGSGGTFFNITNLTWSEGLHNVTIYANDTVGNENFTTISFTIDSIIPAISIAFPTSNNTNTTDILMDVNYTVSDISGIDSAWYANDTYSVANKSLGSGGVFTNLTNLTWSEGKHNVTIYANDTFGNVNFTTISFTIDTTQPTISILNPSQNNTNSSNNNLDVNSTESDSFTLINSKWYSNDTYSINRSLGSGGTFFNISNLTWSEGKHNVTIYANDTVGNENFTTISFTIDTTNPLVVITNPSQNNTNSSNTGLDVNYTATDTFTLIDSVWYANDTYSVANKSLGSGGTYFNITNLTWSEGKHNVTIYANDSVGNENFTTISFTVDSVNPSLTILIPATNNTNTTNTNQNINFTFSDSTGIDSVWYNNDTHAGANKSLGSGGTYFNITNITWSEGLHNVTVYVNDSAGNLNYTSVSFTVDSTQPTISISNPSQNNTNSSSNLLDVNFTASDTTLFNFWYNNDTYSAANKSLGVVGTSFNITNITWGEGKHNVTIWANDSAGNYNFATISFTIDTIQPTISISNPSQNNTNSSNINLDVNFTASDSGSGLFNFWYNNDTFSVANKSLGVLGTSFNISNITWSEGGHNVTVWANDSAGNYNFATISFTIDIVNPNISFVAITEANGSSLTRNNIQINVTASDIGTNIGTITIYLYNSTVLVQSNISTTSPLFVNITNLADEIYYFNATVNDSAGNTNRTETRTATIDTGAPSVNYAVPTEDSGVFRSRSNIQVNVTATDPNLNNINIRLYDSTHTEIRNNLSSTSPFFINYTNLADGLYFYNTSANDTIGNIANTGTRNITLDTTNPSITSLTENPTDPATYASGVTYEFNATITDTNLDSVLIEFNGTNYSVINSTGNVFNFTISNLGGGTYNYKWHANDSAQNANTASGTYTINAAAGAVFTYLNHTRANISIAQGLSIYLNGTLENGTGNIKLYNGGVLINQGTSPLSNLTAFNIGGSFNITTIYEGNENFSSDFETFYVTVLDVVNPDVNLTYPVNTSYNSIQTQLNYTASDNSALSACWYTLDNGVTNTTITCGQNVTGLNSGQGSSTWRIYVNDTSNNLNSSSATFFVDSINPGIDYVSPTDSNDTSFGRNFIRVNVSASDANLINITIRLYNSSRDLLRQNTSTTSPFFINYTSLGEGEYFFNATAADVLNNKNSTSTRNVSLILPNITISKPENKTYLSNISINLNFTSSNADSVWFNLDNGANTTITGNVTFNVSQGGHRLNLFANNSVGEITRNISFSANSTKFTISYAEYNGSEKGNSTDFIRNIYEDIQNLSSVVLENTESGKISFNENINLTNDEDISDNNVDLDSNINISSNRIEINSTALGNFNKSATLSLYGLTFSDPRILRGGVLCSASICTEISYSGGTFVFNVTSFTVYSAEETPSTVSDTGQVSGGAGASGSVVGIAECTTNEQCSNNEVCINSQCVSLFDVKILSFESPVKLGEFFDFVYYIKGMANINDDVVINFWIEREGEIVSSGSDTIFLGSLEEKTETAQIFLPSIVETGVYQFKISISRKDYKAEASRTIEIAVDKEKGFVTITPVEKEGISKNIIYVIIVLLAVLALSGLGARRARGKSIIPSFKMKKKIDFVPKVLDVPVMKEIKKKKTTELIPKIFNVPKFKTERKTKTIPGIIYTPPAGKEINESTIKKTVEDLMEGVRTKTLEKNRQRKDSDEILKEVNFRKSEKQKSLKKPEDLIEEAREKSGKENKDSDEFLDELRK